VAAADVAARIRWAAGLTAGLATEAALDTVDTLVGTSLATQESVPAAFAILAAAPDDPWLACRMAASAGGDTDTIAAMAGAVAGACHGAAAFPAEARRTVAAVNGLRLDEVAASLLAVRAMGGQA
jgi:ADP-ribosylglycohydrolase